MVNNLGKNQQKWEKVVIYAYRNIEDGRTIERNTITIPTFDWSEKSSPLEGGGRLHRDKMEPTHHSKRGNLRKLIPDNSDRLKVYDIIDSIVGISNIICRRDSKGVLSKNFADDEYIANFLGISTKSTREFLNRMIKLDVFRKVEYYSKVFRQKIYVYVLNPYIATVDSYDSLFLYYVFNDLHPKRNNKTFLMLYENDLLTKIENFEPTNEYDKLIINFLSKFSSTLERI